MSKYEYTNNDGIESYAFPSEVVPAPYRHLVDRIDDGPWKIWPVDLTDPMSIDDARVFARELAELIEFADKLSSTKLHRTTEPGEPELAGRGGGL